MNSDEDKELIIQDMMKRILANPPQQKLSDVKRQELIAKLYKIEEVEWPDLPIFL